MNKKEFELALCQKMQASGNCDGIDCQQCEHTQALISTTIELLMAKLNK
jgi:hypothetical protein